MFFISINLLILFEMLQIGAQSVISERSILLVVSFDGFRPEYLLRNLTPTLNEIRSNSARIDYMRNVFPTKTFVNHYTIATGMYPVTHGVLGNEVFDLKSHTNMRYSYDLFHYNEDVVPIWVKIKSVS